MILPITYFVEKPFQNWSRISTELLGTVMLYLDYQVPMAELRKELKRLVENNPKWNRKVCGLQVTDTRQSTIEVRALVSSTDPGKAFDLRCDVREGLIEFLRPSSGKFAQGAKCLRFGSCQHGRRLAAANSDCQSGSDRKRARARRH